MASPPVANPVSGRSDLIPPGSQGGARIVLQDGRGVSPFAQFANTLTPLPHQQAGGSNLARLLKNSTFSNVPPSGGSPLLGSPRIDAPPSVVPAAAAAAAAIAAASAPPYSPKRDASPIQSSQRKSRRVWVPEKKSGDMSTRENLGTNRTGDTDTADQGTSTGLPERMRAAGETGIRGVIDQDPMADSNDIAETASNADGVQSVEPVARDVHRKVVGARRGLQSRLVSQDASTVHPANIEGTPSLQRMSEALDGDSGIGFDDIPFDQMIDILEQDGTQQPVFHSRGTPSSGAVDVQGTSIFDDAGLPVEPGPLKVSKSRGGRPKRCNCRNSKCLKLYCDCFSVGVLCDGCNCQDCKNKEDCRADVEEARRIVLKRNPKAFSAKFVDTEGVVRSLSDLA